MFLCVRFCVCERNKLLPVRQTSNDFKLAAWLSLWHVVTTVSGLCVWKRVCTCVCVLRCAAISWNINWLHLSSLYLCLFSVFVSLFINLIKKLLLYNNYWSVCVHMHRLMCGLLLHKCTYAIQDVWRDNYVKVNRSILSFTTKIPSVLHIYVCSWSLFFIYLHLCVCVRQCWIIVQCCEQCGFHKVSRCTHACTLGRWRVLSLAVSSGLPFSFI